MDELKNEVQELIAGVIDFEGQQKSECVVDTIIYGGSVLSVVAGFVLQRFDTTVYAMLATLVAANVACLPFPKYRQNELKWLEPAPVAGVTSADVIIDLK